MPLSGSTAVSPKQLRAGRVIAGIIVALLILDAGIKVMKSPQAVQATVALGYPESVIVGIGIVEVVCLALYLVPATSVLGAILLTGYFGGATATHVRLGNPWLTHILSGVYVAVLLWLSLWLREPRLRQLIPTRR